MAKSKALQVPLPQELRDRIFDIAHAEGISMAQVVRDILEAGIGTRENLSAQRVGS